MNEKLGRAQDRCPQGFAGRDSGGHAGRWRSVLSWPRIWAYRLSVTGAGGAADLPRW